MIISYFLFFLAVGIFIHEEFFFVHLPLCMAETSIPFMDLMITMSYGISIEFFILLYLFYSF